MTALSAATAIETRSNHLASRGYGTVASGQTIWPGALVSRVSVGGAIVPSGDAAARVFAGIYLGDDVLTAGDTCEFTFGLEAKLPRASALDDAVFVNCAAADDNTVTTVAAPTNPQYVGLVTESLASEAWVQIRTYGLLPILDNA